MILKTLTFIFITSFFCSLATYGQDISDTAQFRKKKIRISHQKHYYLIDGKLQSEATFSNAYYNKNGQVDSCISYYPENKLRGKWINKYDDRGNLLQYIYFDGYYGKTDTVNYQEAKPINEYDSTGKIIVQEYSRNELSLLGKTVFNYDSMSRFIGRDNYDRNGKIIGYDKKKYSKTGKLLTWISFDGNKKELNSSKYYYDEFDSLIVEIDSFSKNINLCKYDYIPINGIRQLKCKKWFEGNHLSSREDYTYIFNEDNSYTQVVVYRIFKNKLSFLWKSIISKNMYYYSSNNTLFKHEVYYLKQLSEVNYYSKGNLDSIMTYDAGRLIRIYKYHKNNLFFRLELSQKSDTLNLEENLYNEYNLLNNSRTLRNYTSTDKNDKMIGIRRDEEISEFTYTYY